VIEDVLYQVSRTAAGSMVLTALCCLCTGLIAILLSNMPGEARAESARRVTRRLSVFGSGTSILAGLTGIPYRWMVGEVSFDTFVAVEIGLGVVFAVWAAAASGRLPVGRVRWR
jgi:hypothetical protein